MKDSKKTVLITGCSSGFGKLTAKLFHKKGWNVIASMRSPEKEMELTKLSDILVTRLDVTDKNSVSNVVTKGLEAFGKIDVLVNNAGIAGLGVFEQWDDKAISSMFDTNVLGLIRVSKEVLPAMRKQGEGIIINLSSLAGILGSPYSSIYSASKFAVEGLSEALALEYAPLNIKVKVIAPGSYNTNLVSSMSNRILKNGDEQIRAYSLKAVQMLNEQIEQMRLQSDHVSDPQEVADKIYECATEKTTVHNVSGKDAESLVQMKNTMSEYEFMKAISQMTVPEL